MHDRARLGASCKIFCGACTDAVEHAGIDGEAPLLSCGDPRTCLRVSIAEAGPGASEPGVRARAEATAAPAPVAHNGSTKAAGQQLFAEYMFASGAGELMAADGEFVAMEPSKERSC